MANVVYGDALGDFGSPQGYFSGTEQFHKFFTKGTRHTKVGVEYKDSSSGATIDVFGDDLTFKGHVPTSGNLTRITLRDVSGSLLLSFNASSDHSYLPIKALYTDIMKHHLDEVVATLISHDQFKNSHGHFIDTGKPSDDVVTGSINGDYLFSGRGNDQIDGGDGDDWITGMAGNDTLTGSTGDDVFWFSKESGHDVITDFDADSNTTDPHQDYIGLLSTGWHKHEIKNAEKLYHVDFATEVTFDDGSSVVLYNVHAKQISAHDFYTQ